MKAMTSFTVKSLRDSAARTAVTIAGVALAAALLVAVLSSYVSATDYLLRNEATANGTWMSQVVLPDDEKTREEIALAEDATDVETLATLQDVGFAGLSNEQRVTLGIYLPILTGTGSIEELCGVRVAEGRLPQNAAEIMLPSTWQRGSTIALGDTITLDVGTRRAVLAPGEQGSMSGGSFAIGDYDPEFEPKGYSIEDGSALNSTMGYLDSEADEGKFDEELTDVTERSYTVVGFAATDNWTLMTGAGPAALTADASATGDIQAFLELSGISTVKQVRERTAELFPDADVQTHINLLRYMGISDHGSIWQTFFYLVAILAVIIIAACVSLIYNAFAISVNERMRQFGLLASIGASKRQLRRSVLLEGGIIAIIGIPIGIAVGLGACAGIFAWLGTSIASILGGQWSSFYLIVDWRVVLFAMALTALTVLVSVWIPALRAARVSPIDALRQSSTIKLSNRAQRASRQRDVRLAPWKHRGIAGSVFGIGGQLASVNHRRNASKGRAASVSLALAIILLMTAGSLSTQLDMFTKVAGNLSDADVSMTVSMDPTDERTATSSVIEATGTDAYVQACAVENVTPLGWGFVAAHTGLVPPTMAGSALSNAVTPSSLVDGDVPTPLYIAYLPADEFAAYAKDNGIELPEGGDTPVAIGVRDGYSNTGTMYSYDELFARTGTLDIVTGIKGDDTAMASIMVTDTTDDGRQTLEFMRWEKNGGYTDQKLAPDQLVRTPVQIVGLADKRPACATSSSGAMIVASLESANVLPLIGATDNLYFSAAFDTTDGEAAVKALSPLSTVFEDAGYKVYYNQVTDHKAQEQSMTMMVTVVNLFCFLFSFILTLIALANVFNTMTNGLILRKREFAVMESIGMGACQFRSMIGCECIGYGLRGLIPGIIVSFGVSYLLYMALGVSMRGLPYTPPWMYLVLGCGLVIVVMAASVLYGLHRCRKGDIVDALRME